MGKRKLGALEKIEADFANLQYKIRRDPASYHNDFIEQYRQYQAMWNIFMRTADSETNDSHASLLERIDFVAHVADCYKSDTEDFAQGLMTIIESRHSELEPALREKIISSLLLLRKKEIIRPEAYEALHLMNNFAADLVSPSLFPILFPILIKTPSKSFRAFLSQKILSDLRQSNSKAKNHKLNRDVQNFLFNFIIEDRTSAKGLWAVKITRELWKRQIWTDTKAVEIMKEASLAQNEKVVVGGVRFFLGGDQEREEIEDESSDGEQIDIGQVKHQLGINKKTKKKSKQLEKAVSSVKKKERKRKQPHPLNFSALHLLHDPQGFAENLFSRHLEKPKSRLGLEQKLLVLQLVSRLVGLHKLTIVSLYSFFVKYLNPRQQSVTTFLACLAQSTHNQVPPDVLEPLTQKIANEFISEGSASEVASAGLNSIREICARQPLAVSETLLQDLVMYKKSKDKGVMMAAKGLLSLYREVGANLLKKRDRGKAATMGIKSGERKEQRFGEERAGEIEGLELLQTWKEEEKMRKKAEKDNDGISNSSMGEEDDDDGESSDAEEEAGGWNMLQEFSESDDSGSWNDVSSEDEEEEGDQRSDHLLKKRRVESDAGDSDENDRETANKENILAKIEPNSFATSTILTPADFAKLQELRIQAGIDKAMGLDKRKKQIERHIDDPLTAASIEATSSLSRRADRESKIAAAKAGKTDRTEFKSKEARRQERKAEQGKSSTNKEKARKKNFLMTLGKARGKKKRSLTEQRRVLKSHVERSKRGGRRGNKG